jgi:zinc protease
MANKFLPCALSALLSGLPLGASAAAVRSAPQSVTGAIAPGLALPSVSPLPGRPIRGLGLALPAPVLRAAPRRAIAPSKSRRPAAARVLGRLAARLRSGRVAALAETFDLSASRGAPAQGDVSTFALDNGLAVVVQPDFTVPVVAVSITYKVGSMDEEPGTYGWAHAHEHLMFDGTPEFPGKSFDRVIEAYAGKNNAFTSQTDTTYIDTVLADGLPKVLEAEASRMRELSLKEDVFRREIEVVLQEWRQNHTDRPYAGIMKARLQGAFTDPGKAHTVIGEEADIRAATPALIRSFRARHYAPDNAVIAITGPVSPAEARKLVQAAFGGIPSSAEKRRVPPLEPRLEGTRTTVIEDPLAKAPLTYLTWPMPPRKSRDFWGLTLLSTLFSQGEASPLYQSLVKAARLAVDAGAGSPSPAKGRGVGLFDVFAVHMPGVSAEGIVSAVDALLARLAHEGPTEAELELAKAQAERDWISDLDEMDDRAVFLSNYSSMVGDPKGIGADLRTMLSVTAQDMARAVRRWLVERGRVVIHDVPAELPGGAVQAAHAPAVKPQSLGGELTREELLKEAGKLPPVRLPPQKSFRLDNGLEVRVVEDHRLPLVRMALSFPRGYSHAAAAEMGTCQAAVDLLFSGTRERDAAAVGRDFARLGFQAGSEIDADRTRVEAGGLSRNLPAFLKLLRESLTGASYPEEEVGPWAERAGEEIKVRDSNSMMLAAKALLKRVFPGHSYGRKISESDLGGLDAARIREMRDRMIAPEGATLLVYGDVDSDALKPVLGEALGTWQGSREASSPAPVPEPSVVPEMIHRPASSQASLVMGLSIPVRLGDADYLPLLLLNEVFGGSSDARLFENLREAKGYTYGVYSAIRKFDRCLLLMIQGGIRPDAVGDSISEIRKEMARLGAEPVGEDELAAAKRRLIGNYLMNLSSLSGRAAQMQFFVENGLDPARAMAERIRRIESLTAGDLLDVARRRLDAARLSTVVVADEALVKGQVGG